MSSSYLESEEFIPTHKYLKMSLPKFPKWSIIHTRISFEFDALITRTTSYRTAKTLSQLGLAFILAARRSYTRSALQQVATPRRNHVARRVFYLDQNRLPLFMGYFNMYAQSRWKWPSNGKPLVKYRPINLHQICGHTFIYFSGIPRH